MDGFHVRFHDATDSLDSKAFLYGAKESISVLIDSMFPLNTSPPPAVDYSL